MSNENAMKNYIEKAILMERLGIHIEDIKEIGTSIWDSKEIIYFSVPEKSEMNFEGFKNKTYADSDELIEIGKELSIHLVCVSANMFDTGYPEVLEDEVKEYCEFRAKVREGEIWTKEMSMAKAKEITEEIEKLSVYKKV